MTDNNASRFGLVSPAQIPTTFGAQDDRQYIRKSLTYEDYMEMLSLLQGLESVVGTRQISDYMNALKVAQRNSPIDIDPANVISSMGRLYAEKSNHPFSGDKNTNSPGNVFSLPPVAAVARGTTNFPATYGRIDALRSHPVRGNPLGRLDSQVASAFQEIARHSGVKRYTTKDGCTGNGATMIEKKKTASIQVPEVRQVDKSVPQAVPFHMLRSQLQNTQGAPISFVEKRITNGSYLLRFNVTTDLAKLLPEYKDDFSPGFSALKDAPRSLFKRNISLIDSSGKFHCVKYEGIVSSKQRHNRLTTGWSGVVKSLGIKVGDTIIFERWTVNHAIIHITIIPGNQDWDEYDSTVRNDVKKKKLDASASIPTKFQANTSPVQAIQETSKHVHQQA